MGLVSMTGFADAQGAAAGVRWRWEAKSVNGRSFDVRLRLPMGFESIEPPARILAADRFRRGNIQATLTFEPVDGARALKLDPAALAAAVKIAKEIAALPPIGIMQIKEIVNAGLNAPLDTALMLERKALLLQFATQDQKEGMRAFLEKRKPTFEGK